MVETTLTICLNFVIINYMCLRDNALLYIHHLTLCEPTEMQSLEKQQLQNDKRLSSHYNVCKYNVYPTFTYIYIKVKFSKELFGEIIGSCLIYTHWSSPLYNTCQILCTDQIRLSHSNHRRRLDFAMLSPVGSNYLLHLLLSVTAPVIHSYPLYHMLR